MKRLAMIFIMLSVAAVYLFSAQNIADDQIRVEFASEKPSIFGFSKNSVTTLSPVDSMDLIETSQEAPQMMTVSIAKGVYTTGQFHFYAQLFQTDPISIAIKGNGPLKNDANEEIQYVNVGAATAEKYSGSDVVGEIELVNEGTLGTEKLSYPRVYSFDFEFQVPFDSINDKNGSYSSYVTIVISSDKGGQA